MGENLKIEGRLAVRVPMQWTAEPGGGFSTADPSTFPEPLAEGEFGPKQVNVRDQSRDPDSLLIVLPPPGRLLPGVPRAGLGDGPGARPRPGRRGRCSRTAADADGVAIVAVHNFGGPQGHGHAPAHGAGG